jgi:hypothetical protein
MTTQQGKKMEFINSRDAIAIALMSVASFVIETTLGLVLLPFIPFPLMGGLLSAFFDSILIFTAIFLVPRLGAPLLFGVLLLTMSTVTPSFGPIGAYKVLIGIGLGVALEVLLLVLGRGKSAYVVATAVGFGLSIPMTYLAWVHFGIPGADELKPVVPMLTAAYTIIGAIGASVAAWIYTTRLSRYEAVRRLRGKA